MTPPTPEPPRDMDRPIATRRIAVPACLIEGAIEAIRPLEGQQRTETFDIRLESALRLLRRAIESSSGPPSQQLERCSEPPRDLERDLEICEAATPGPWVQDWNYISGPIPGGRPNGEVIGCARPTVYGLKGYPEAQQRANAAFIAAARTGWPAAIRRAIAAEARVRELEAELGRCAE